MWDATAGFFAELDEDCQVYHSAKNGNTKKKQITTTSLSFKALENGGARRVVVRSISQEYRQARRDDH
jgi:hypothetical protein